MADNDEETKAAKAAIAKARSKDDAPSASEPPPISLTNAVRKPVDLSAEGFTKGPYIYRRDGSEMMLQEIDPAKHPRGHTHALKSQELYWEGSKEDFQKEFEKK